MQFLNKSFLIFVIYLIFPSCYGWENLPLIPTGRRSQYLLVENNGAYKYGYDTGSGLSAKQSGSPDNQVEGHYFYTAPSGEKIDLKYTSGVQGFKPDGFDSLEISQHTNLPAVVKSSIPTSSDSDDQSDTGDASYAFTIDTDTYKRQEVSDASGHVKGSYSFKNKAGSHDLSYVAGADTGFVARSGSLSLPNGLTGSNYEPQVYTHPSASIRTYNGENNIPVDVNYKNDGSYTFSYSTGDSSREESSDSNGNVQGRYSYQNNAGKHDLTYKAGSETGFIATGGSLSVPNGLSETILPTAYRVPSKASNLYSPKNIDSDTVYNSNPNNDGSYSFSYSSKDSSREESSDRSGNVKGKYKFQNEAGNHDLSYVAGSDTGFLVTGGSLSVPNGIPSKLTPYSISSPTSNSYSSETKPISDDLGGNSANNDGSYSFSYSTGDSSRIESSDASGNVKGQYAFQNEAGNHDLSYVAGSDTGFLVTGGSLSVPNGISSKVTPYSLSSPTASSYSTESKPSSANFAGNSANNDGSYSFSYSTGDSSRVESADVSGNVQGRYSFQNEAGSHDLSYVAGSNTGFLPTGGSLSTPNGIIGSSANFKASQTISSGSLLPVLPIVKSSVQTDNDSEDLSDTGDASYTFNIDTDTYKRHETSDSAGNVKGHYSYSNSAGSHDLGYIAGSNTGFVATSGSLKEPPGLADGQLNIHPVSGSTNFQAKSYFPQSERQLELGSSSDSEDDLSNTGDSSYNFSIDTDSYSRHESSDASGNVKGSYSYKNSAGSHDLQYVAGSETGFVATSGSLKTPPGLTEAQLKSGTLSQFKAQTGSHNAEYKHPEVFATRSNSGSKSPTVPFTSDKSGKISYDLDNLSVKTYLPPSNDKNKFGYVFDSQ